MDINDNESPLEKLRRIKRIYTQLYSISKTDITEDVIKTTPLERLDIVLKYFETIEKPPFRTDSEILSELKNNRIVFSNYSDELLRILHKLEFDENIRSETSGIGAKNYYATFDGNLFLSQGGYAQKERDIIQQRERYEIDAQRIADNEKWLKRGAVGAAIGSIAYLIWDVVKYFLDKNGHYSIAVLFLLLAFYPVYRLVKKLP